MNNPTPTDARQRDAAPEVLVESSNDSALARGAQILKFMLKHRKAGVFSGLTMESSQLDDAPVETEHDDPEAFVADLEAMGPAFIKLGQALSTRPEMAPPSYIKALERIQDNVSPLPYSVVEQLVEQELGVRINKLFAEFDEAPLAAASIGQVHKARLRDGRPVAVKVQRPNVDVSIRTDLDVLYGMADKADRWTDLGNRLQFSSWIQEFRKSLLAELDYRQEAENLERFARNLESEPLIIVPKPVWDYTTNRILVMDLIDGTKVTDISGTRRAEENLDEVAGALLRAYLDQVFVHGEIHADPHPGNLLLTRDSQIALLDLGMVAHVPPKRREQLLKMIFAAVDGRGEDVASEMVAMGTRLEDFDAERYQREIGQMVARYSNASGKRAVSEGRLVLDLTMLGSLCGLRTPPELSLLGKTLLNLEAVSNALNPELDVKKVVESHLEQIMRKRMMQAMSPAKLASDAMELHSLVSGAPRKLSNLLTLLSDNQLQVKVTGLEESHLMENIQKIANRISTGIIVAALIVASAMLMRQDGGPRLMGYPALATILFLIAAVLGLGIVVSALFRDRKAKPRETRGIGS